MTSKVDPRDLTFARKCVITGLLSMVTFTTTFASSIFTAAIPPTSQEYNKSETVMVLGISLYVLGFALAPPLWGPMGEMVGRKIPIMTGFTLFALLQIPTALTPDLVGLFLCRFLAGAMGAAAFALVSAVNVDIWDTSARGTAQAMYGVAVFLGPTIGPVAGAYLTESMGWRWTAWIILIVAAPIGILVFFFVPETYAPVLNKEQQSKLTFGDFATKYLIRPVDIVRHEVVFDVMTIYSSLAYGILYLTFYAVPYIFREDRGWSETHSVLPFLAFLVGVLITAFCQSMFYRSWLTPRLIARGSVRPEDRLPPVMVGSFALPLGLFWLAWTSHSHWFVQVLSLCFVGCGVMLLFNGCLIYLTDLYTSVAASAMAANTCIRSITAAGLPLAAPTMYKQLGTAWATTLLGLICVLLIPAPFIFMRYGEKFREKTKYGRKDIPQPSV